MFLKSLVVYKLSSHNLVPRFFGHTTRKQIQVVGLTPRIKSTYHAIRAAVRTSGLDKNSIENYIYLK